MERKIRVGVIGTSGFAEGTHYAPLASHPAVELAALCGRNTERAAALAQKFGIPRVFNDWRALIEQGEVDAVVVVTPDDLHYPITMAALNAGKHVFCEKALAMNAAQAQEMYQTAEQRGLTHMTMFTFRWEPAVAYMHELIQQGYVGEVFQGQFSYQLSLGRHHQYQWRADPKQSNGMIADLGSHLIDMARWLCGDVQRVACRAGMYMEHAGPDGGRMAQNNDAAVCLLEFAGGAQATLQVSSVTHLGGEIQVINLQVYGSEGTLVMNYPHSQGGTLSGARGPEGKMEILPIPERFNVSLTGSPIGERLFIDSILSGTRPEPSFYEGWKVQQVVDAAIRASLSGKWEPAA